MGDVRIGMAGWTYAPWRGAFYPPKLTQKKELGFASQQVGAIEINGTFYRLQKPASFRQWFAETPDDFMFAVKATGYITHKLRLKGCEQPLRNFLASGVLLLGKKLGPILWQLPPNLPRVDSRFEDFMAMLPRTTREAAVFAAEHDGFVKTDDGLIEGDDTPLRHAFEFRHESFRDYDFLMAMRKLDIALVIADSGEHSLGIEEVTADHVYFRLHGQAEEFQESGYTEAALEGLAAKIRTFAARPNVALVSAFFDNDAKAHAPLNAKQLQRMLGLRRAA